MATLMPDAAVTNMIAANTTVAAYGQGTAAPTQLDGSFGPFEPSREAGDLGITPAGAASQRVLELELYQLHARFVRQQAQLREARRQLAAAQAAAQKDLARHLHDNIGASLTGLNLDLTMILHELARATPDTDTVRALAEDALCLIGQVGAINSGAVAELRPPHLEQDGLTAALAWYVQAFRPRVTFPITLTVDPDLPRLDPLVEYQLYQIAQEAIVNAARHAEPQSVAVTLQATADGVRLVVADDGKGIDPAHLAAQAADPHWGLTNVVERAELVGGTCNIISHPGLGTQIIAEVMAEEGR
jgi:signal transduction histidine kinase